jgi:ubiquitin-protein ligase
MKSKYLSALLVVSIGTAGSLRAAAQGAAPAPATLPSQRVAPAPASPAVTPPAAAPAASGPIIQFDSTTFDFGKAAFGTKIQHTYVVTNKGDQPLEISNVHPSCGCTTAGTFTHRIEPGQSGAIPIQFDSGHGGPGNIIKTIDVTSNAKNEPHVSLRLTGNVWKPIETIPATTIINIAADATNGVSRSVKIVNNSDQLVTLSPPTSSTRGFSAELKEIKPGREFELVITAEPPFNNGYSSANISMNCSYPGTPVVSVMATAAVTPAVQFYPSQISLNAVPADRWFTNRVTIRSTTTNVLLALSNPQASDSRIQVEVRPERPTGTFTLTVAFPPGFELQPGERAEVSVQSNHPRYPVIKVPVIQYFPPRPVARPAPTPDLAARQQAFLVRGAGSGKGLTNTAPPAPPMPNPPVTAGHP